MSLLGSAVHAITAGLVEALSPADVSCPAEWIHQGGTRTSWKELGSTLTKEEWAERRRVLVDEGRRRRAPSGPPAETMAETLARLGDDNDSDDENTETVTIPVQQGYEDVAIRVTHEGEVDNEDVNCVPAFVRGSSATQYSAAAVLFEEFLQTLPVDVRSAYTDFSYHGKYALPGSLPGDKRDVDVIIGEFFTWIGSGGPARPISIHVVKNTESWCADRIRQQCAAQNYRAPAKGFVGAIPSVQNVKKRFENEFAHRVLKQFKDPQSETREGGYTSKQFAGFLNTCLAPANTSQCFKRADALNQLQTACAIAVNHQYLFRGDDTRFTVLAFLQVHRAPRSVGRERIDTSIETRRPLALTLLSSGGKTNRTGRVRTTSALPHRDVLLCGPGKMAMVLVHRLTTGGEDWPDFCNRESWFRLPVLRGKQRTTAVTASTLYRHISSVFDANDFKSKKKQHAGRVQGQRDNDDQDCPHEDILRLAHYLHSAAYESYMNTAPWRAIVCSAGCGAERKDYYAARHTVAVPDEVIDILLPKLRASTEVVEARFREVTADVAERECLFASRGCLKALRFLAEVFLRDAASRRIADNGEFYGETQLVTYSGLPVYAHAVFKTAAFARLAADVRIAEEAAAATRIVELPPELSVHMADAVKIGTAELVRTLEANTQHVLAMKEAVAAETMRMANIAQRADDQVLALPNAGAAHTQHALCAKQRCSGIVPMCPLQNMSVMGVWLEYVQGIGGNASLKEMESKGSAWRKYKGGRATWFLRRFVHRAVERRVADGMTEDEAIQDLEHLRGQLRRGASMNHFIKSVLIPEEHRLGISTGNAGSAARKRKAST